MLIFGFETQAFVGCMILGRGNSNYLGRQIMRVLVAGATGLAGSAIVRNCPQDISLFEPTRSQLNLQNFEKVSSYLSENRIEAVIFAAGKVGGILANSKYQKDFLLQNLKIQNSVLEASLKNKVKKFIFLGSSCIYPKFASQPIKEDELMNGYLEATNEGYALAKITGVRLCKAIFDELGYDYISLMPTNLYGINDNFDAENSHVPAALMRRVHEAKVQELPSVKIWGSGRPQREFMSSDDLADACWYFLNSGRGGELINIGTGLDISIRDFASILARIVDYSGNFEFDESMPDGSPRKLLDISKARSFGWRSKISLEDGLENTYKWFRRAYDKGEIRGY